MFTGARPRVHSLVGVAVRHGVNVRLRDSHWEERLRIIRTYVKEDPTVTYDLHAAFSKDPNTVKVQDAWDDYTKIQQAAIRAGVRPPKKKRPRFDAVGNRIGSRIINRDVPLRIRERLIAEGLEMDPQFFIGRFGLNKEVVKSIRSAFRLFEIVRIELGSPWTDNPVKFAERLELRTGAMVLDGAGSRVLLYRGFTHADLARKGLDSSSFTVGRDYMIRQKRDQESERRPARQTGMGGRGRGRGRHLPSTANSQSRQFSHSSSRNVSDAMNLDEDLDSASDDDDTSWEEDAFESEDQSTEQLVEASKTTVIDIDNACGGVLAECADGVLEEEDVANLVSRIQYNAARAKESKQYTAARRQRQDCHEKRLEASRNWPRQ